MNLDISSGQDFSQRKRKLFKRKSFFVSISLFLLLDFDFERYLSRCNNGCLYNSKLLTKNIILCNICVAVQCFCHQVTLYVLYSFVTMISRPKSNPFFLHHKWEKVILCHIFWIICLMISSCIYVFFTLDIKLNRSMKQSPTSTGIYLKYRMWVFYEK